MEDRRRALALTVAGALPARVASLALLALLAAPRPAAALPIGAAPVETARQREVADHALHGRHAAVADLLGAAKDRSDAESAALGLALRHLGQLAEARKVWRACVQAPSCAEALAAFELEAGEREEAVKVLTKATARHPDALSLRVLLGAALYSVGRDVVARRLLDPLADLYAERKVQRVDEMVAVARSLALNGFFKDANQVMADANEAVVTAQERKLVELGWGQLFLSKYNFRDADVAFAKVLALDPYDLHATLGMARIDLDSDHDIGRARTRLDALLARDGAAVGALVLRAEVALHDEDLDAADALLAKAAQLAPSQPQLLAVRAALAGLRDDAKGLEAAAQAARKVDATDATPYLVAAHYLEMAHRYDEVRALLTKAIARDPELWQAHAALGLAMSRVADDDKALEHLTTAFRNDPFNVRTANLLNELYDGVLKQMIVLPGKHVELRVHRRERKALERSVLPFLQQSYGVLAERYAMEARKPLRVEIFPTAEQFSVRTVGLPRLGAHAVCFGHLITSRSPVEAPFNFKMVLHHEMAHVFHIQATGGRVPRWLTEGLAMMESAWLDPRYHMILERELYDRLHDGELSPTATFNLAFSQARSMGDIIGAYYQAMWLVRFLDARFGFAKLRELVALHRDGAPTAKLLAKVYGHSPAELDGKFATWLRSQLQRFDADFRPTPARIGRWLRSGWHEPASLASSAEVAALRKWHRAYEAGNGAAAARALEAATRALPNPAGGGDGRDGAADDAEDPDDDAADGSTGRDDDDDGRPARAGDGPGDSAKPTPPGGRAAKADADDASRKGVGVTGPVPPPMCALRYLAMEAALSRRQVDRAAGHARALVEVANGACDGVRQRLVLARAEATTAAGKARAQVHLTRAHRIDPRDATVLLAWVELGKGTLDDVQQRELLRKALRLLPNQVDVAERLAKLAWAGLAPNLGLAKGTTAAATPTATISPARGEALRRDLQLAAQQLEEAAPASRGAALYEARSLVARGQGKAALPAYRLAAERGGRPRHRAEAWCELQLVAAGAGAEADAGEAARRCAAEGGAPEKGPAP